MKKLIVTLLCAMLLCAMLQPAVYAASDSIEIKVNGRQLTLMFDRSEQFSNVTGGYVQASFYTYLDDSSDLYELYMIFPVNVQPGTTINPEYAFQNAPESSVVMIVTTKASADYYFAGQTDSSDAADYAMTFESVTASGSGRTYSGTLSASMIGMAADSETEIAPLVIQNAHFSFTMPLTGDRLPEDAPDEIPGDSPDDAPPAADDPFGEDDYDSFVDPAPTRETFRV